jgi:hypothetical protein
MKNHEFYRVEENKSKSANCGCGGNTSASVIKKTTGDGAADAADPAGTVPGNDFNNGTGTIGNTGNDFNNDTGFGGDPGGSGNIGLGDDIKNYFKDGFYTVFGVGIPSCTFPNGPTYIGNVKIYSTYHCNDLTQPFLQKNIVSETGVSLDALRISTFTFNINDSAIAVNNLGSAYSGTYTITKNQNNEKNILTTIYDEGYNNSLGRNVPLKIVFQLTPGGFTALHYYLDKYNGYQIQCIRQYTYKSPL